MNFKSYFILHFFKNVLNSFWGEVMGFDVGLKYRISDDRVVVFLRDREIHVMKRDYTTVEVEYRYSDGRNYNFYIEEDNIDDVEYLATYVVAEIFNAIVEENGDIVKEDEMKLYSFFQTEECHELEKGILNLKKIES